MMILIDITIFTWFYRPINERDSVETTIHEVPRAVKSDCNQNGSKEQPALVNNI